MVQDDLVLSANLFVSRVGDLSFLPWNQRVEVHWALQEAQFVPAAVRVTPRGFLRAVAQAVGGTLVEKGPRDFFIDLDLPEFQRRGNETLRLFEGSERTEPYRRKERVRRLAFARLTLADLRKLTATRESVLFIPFSPPSPEFAEVREAALEMARSSVTGGAVSAEDLDWNLPAGVEFRGIGGMAISVGLRGNRRFNF